MNKLRIVKSLSFGIYLDGGEEYGEILMPKKYIPTICRIDDYLDAFVYFDSEDRIIATTEKPLAFRDQIAYLRVNQVSNIGAFLDWGVAKDLLVPFREQTTKMVKSKRYLVYIYLDEKSNRLVASMKIHKFLNKTIPEYQEMEEVDLLIAAKTELGYNAVINNTHLGVLYENEIFQRLRIGQEIKGYIKKIRDDHKIDLTLQKKGLDNLEEVANKLLEYLRENQGSMPFTDKTDSQLIREIFKISKKNFKAALGILYKRKEIILEKDQTRLA